MSQHVSITNAVEKQKHRKNLPSFVKKLWIIVNDPETNRLICWTQQGEAIWIPEASTFSKAVLPRYFKHNNWQSFVRQLNLYGFRKVSEVDLPIHGPRRNSEGWQFRHDQFRRDAENTLHHVQRRRSICRPIASGSPTSPSASPYPQLSKRAALPVAAQSQQEYEPSDDASHVSGNDNAVSDRLIRLGDMLESVHTRTAHMYDTLLQLRVAQTQQQQLLTSVVSFTASLMVNDEPNTNETICQLKQRLAQRSNTRLHSIPTDGRESTPRSGSPPANQPLQVSSAPTASFSNTGMISNAPPAYASEPSCGSCPAAHLLKLPPIYRNPFNPPHMKEEHQQHSDNGRKNLVTLPCISTGAPSIAVANSSSASSPAAPTTSSSSSLPTLRSLALP